MAIEQIETEDVKVNLYNNVTKESVVKAVNEELLELSDDIINEKKKQDIIDLIKEGKTKEIQTQLGMKDNVHADLKERADNMFGKRTLENLKAGKVVGQKETSDTDKKPDITKASEEKQGIEGKDDF
ncbi:TPA: hypothetical protein DCZ39_04075 [Patescibacteria group bacterium]|nr:hypothetical protein [Candidatus Gracilibacteria bacterium]